MSEDNMFEQNLRYVRTALYVPASNIRAMEKARGLDVDMVIIDLEDAVPVEEKEQARLAAREFAKAGIGGKILTIRVNSPETVFFADDVAAFQDVDVQYFVVPKVQSVQAADHAYRNLQKPLLAMIETPAGLYAARAIAEHPHITGLIAGTNDIAAECGVTPGPERQGLELSLQMIILAAASAQIPAFDGVNNQLDDLSGFETECRQGYGYGFTGKTIIHPNQVAIANRCFSPDETALTDAKMLLVEANAGAERFRGRMIENMHVEKAKYLIRRANQFGKRGDT